MPVYIETGMLLFIIRDTAVAAEPSAYEHMQVCRGGARVYKMYVLKRICVQKGEESNVLPCSSA